MSIAEKLREAAAIKPPCCNVDYIALALTDAPAKCEGLCRECTEEWHRRLADAIEAELNASKPTPLPEGIEWPRYEDGTPVKFGDEIVGVNRMLFRVDAVGFTKDGAFVSDSQWKQLRHLPTFERYKPDTQEAIDADCMMDAKDYCEKHGIKTEWPKHHGKAKCEHLLARQRKLMEAQR